LLLLVEIFQFLPASFVLHNNFAVANSIGAFFPLTPDSSVHQRFNFGIFPIAPDQISLIGLFPLPPSHLFLLQSIAENQSLVLHFFLGELVFLYSSLIPADPDSLIIPPELVVVTDFPTSLSFRLTTGLMSFHLEPKFLSFDLSLGAKGPTFLL